MVLLINSDGVNNGVIDISGTITTTEELRLVAALEGPQIKVSTLFDDGLDKRLGFTVSRFNASTEKFDAVAIYIGSWGWLSYTRDERRGLLIDAYKSHVSVGSSAAQDDES